MAIAPEEGMTAAERRAANAAVNQARIQNPILAAAEAKATQDRNIAESDERLRARIAKPTKKDEAPKDTDTSGTKVSTGSTAITPEQTGLSAAEIQALIKSYTSDVLGRMSEQEKTAERLSAYNILRMEFEQYGLGSLVTDIKDLLINNTPVSEFGLRLRGTDAYRTRFKANEARIAAGLAALSPAEYVALEDQYQNIMRNYGLPASYYTKDQTGKQVGFEKFIAGDVSATELEDRIATAQKRVLNANPEVSTALKAFYPDIQNGDILAYALDPSQGLENIKRKVTAAEIGGAAMAQGLATGAERAMQLAGYGVTKAQAQEGFQAIAGIVPRAQQLSGIYKQGQYGQTQAEQEVFGLAGAEEASRQRKKLTELERASFSGSSGAAGGALGRERAMGQGQI